MVKRHEGSFISLKVYSLFSLILSLKLIEIHSFAFQDSLETKIHKITDFPYDKELELIQATDTLVKTLKMQKTASLQSSICMHESLRSAICETDLIIWSEMIGHFPFLQEAIERHPLLMARVFTSDKLHTAAYLLHKRAGVSSSQWCEKLSKNPPSRYRARKLTTFFKSRLSFSSAEINKVILSQPKLFKYRVERFEEVVDYLSSQVQTSDVKAMVKRWPILLTHSVEKRIKPGVAFLKSLGNSRWKRVLVKYPQVLTHSVHSVLRPKLKYLADLLNVRSAKNLVANYPPLLWLSSDLLLNKLEFLKEKLELTQEEVEVLVETYPQVLGLSIKSNLMPKINYLRQELPPEELRDIVLYQPAILAYSLNNRIIPRFERMKAAGIAIAYAPKYLMSITDKKFEIWLTLQISSWTVVPDDDH